MALSQLSLAANDQPQPGSRYLSPEFIERYSHEYDPYGLASLLATQPGVALQSSGDPGGEDWVTFRGNPRDSSRMTLMLMDGVPLNGASNSTLEFNSIPLNLIHDITIYYGPLPARYGGYTSVVELRTRAAANRTEISAYSGSLDTLGGGVTFSRAQDQWGITVDLQAHETDGLEGQQFIRRTVDNSNPFEPEIITEFPSYEDRDYQQIVPTITGHFDIADSVRIGLLAQGLFTEKSYADGQSADEPDRPAERERDFYTIGLSLRPTVTSQQDFELNLFYKDEDKETLALDDEFVNYGEQQKEQLGIRGHYGFRINDALSIRIGGEYNDFKGKLVDDTAWDPVNEEIIEYDSRSEYDSIYFALQDSLDNHAFFAEAFYNLGDWASLSAGVRRDEVENTESEDSWNINARFSLTDTLALTLSGGESARYPSLNEYNNSLRDPSVLGPPIPGLVDPDDVAAQNQKLHMETQQGGEVGLSWTAADAGLSAELIYFSYEHKGEVFVDVRSVPNNLDPSSPLFDILGPEIGLLLRNNRPTEDDSEGVELALNYSTEALGLFFNATWNELTRHYTDGRSSENQAFTPPEYFAAAGGYIRIGQGEVDMQIDYRGDTNDSLQERGPLPDVELDSSVLVHLGYKHRVQKNIELFVRAYNLFDEDYETFYGLPMVERHITAGFRATF